MDTSSICSRDSVNKSTFFPDQQEYQQLLKEGNKALQDDEITELRKIVARLYAARIGSTSNEDILSSANILRG